MTKETVLKMAVEFIPVIERHQKSITIRSTVVCYGLCDFAKEVTIIYPGQDVKIGLPTLIEEISHYKLVDIPLVDMDEDGFETFRECFDCLKGFYPELTLESDMTVVKFRLK